MQLSNVYFYLLAFRDILRYEYCVQYILTRFRFSIPAYCRYSRISEFSQRASQIRNSALIGKKNPVGLLIRNPRKFDVQNLGDLLTSPSQSPKNDAQMIFDIYNKKLGPFSGIIQVK